MASKDGLELHVISSTHWDREWYNTFQEFRIQLVDCLDLLLKLLDEDPKFWRFTLDGQTSPVEDYLEIHPEKAEAIKKYAKGGQIELGPWYVLADEWLASPESHIRNMQIGTAIARKFGSEMRVAYLPDEFGHIGQMPQIIAGFGMDSAFFSRGCLVRDTSTQFWWVAPDGTKVLANSQGYGNGSRPFRSPEGQMELIDEEVNLMSQRTKTGHVLLIVGSDHRDPLPRLPELVKEYGKTRPHKISHTTLGGFFDAIKKTGLKGIPSVSGELRDHLWVGTALTLYNCLSSRMFNKQANQKCNDELEKWAEPLTGIAAQLGITHPSALLYQSWKYLIQNYAHDSICGCSIDKVHDQMMTRFESSEEIANTLKGRAQKGISIKAKLGKIPEGAPVFSVWNPSTHARSGLVEVILEAPKDWPKQSGITIIDAKGNRIAAQTVAKKTDEDLGVTFFTMRSHTRVNPRAFSFWADDLPALGYRIYAAIPEETPAKTPLKWGANWAENEFVMFKIAGNGSLTVEDKTSGAIFSGAGMFEDGGDRGGGYHFEAPAKDTVITSKDTKAKVELVEAGPAQVRFRVEVVMRIPERLSVRRTARAGKKSQLKMVTYVTLGAGSKSIKFRTQVFNNAVDHRLRVIFPTGLKTDVIHVDGHFDVLERPISRDKKPWPTEHHLRWVELSDGATGLAVMNQGLPEYEVTDDKSRTICLTLFRSNTYMTKEWWPTIKTPQAEFIGKSEYEYAVYVHGGDWKKGAVQAEAEAAMLPAKIFQTHLTAPAGHDGELPSEQSFIAVDSNVAVTSIVKKADNRDSMVIRLYNPDKAQTQATIKTWKPIKKAYALNLWEEQTESLTPANGTLKLKIPAKKIVTVEIVV